MSEPRVDILMATYNGERFIGEQIKSIQAQTYRNWRIMVSDDCSSDATLDVVKRYGVDDDRIRIVSEGIRYGGAKENFFALLGKSNADYVMFCDQDDVWRNDKIAVEMDAILNYEQSCGRSCPVMAHSNLALIDGDGRPLGSTMRDLISDADYFRISLAQLLFTNVVTGCTMILNRACIDECLKIDCLDNISMHDWWIALVACILGERIYIDECLVFYRQHTNNVVGAPEKKYPISVMEKAKKTRHFMLESKMKVIGKGMARSISACLCQARELRCNFHEKVKPADDEALCDVCSLNNVSIVRRLAIMNKYHLWKKDSESWIRQFLGLLYLKRRSS